MTIPNESPRYQLKLLAEKLGGRQSEKDLSSGHRECLL